MKTTKRQLTLLSILTILTLAWGTSACSVKAGSDDGDAPNPFDHPIFDKPAIQGPDVKGTWTSDCVAAYTGKRILTMKFTENKFTYTNDMYSDSACQTKVKTDTWSGDYQFSAVADNTYTIDYYYFTEGVNYYQYGQALEAGEGLIYISEFTWGTLPTVNHSLPLRKQADNGEQKPNPTPTPPLPTPSCTNYNGTYQMNSDYFKLAQTGCQKIVWTALASYYQPEAKEYTYVTDGQYHDVEGASIKTYFNKDQNFTMEYLNTSGNPVMLVYKYDKRPCNLMNPDGQNYLTREAYISGQYRSDLCKFYSRRN